jgi:hypothetical protein
MNAHVRDCLVTDFEELIPALTLMWLDWARAQADGLDPFCESPPSILEEDPKQFEDPRPSYLGSWYDR